MRFLHNDNGFSLAELMVVSALVGVIATASYTLLNAFSISSDLTQARAAASSSAQSAIDAITRNLMQAQHNDSRDASGTFSVAQPTYVQFFADVNHDSKPERVSYYVSGGTLYETVAFPIGSAVPFSFGSTGTPVAILTNLSPQNTSIFTYYSSPPSASATWGPGPVVSTSDPQNYATEISLVRVNLANGVTVGSQTTTVTTTELVRIRSVNNSAGS